MNTSTLLLKRQTAMALKRQLTEKRLTCGVWVLRPEASENPLSGPFRSISDAHVTRAELPGVPAEDTEVLWCIWPADILRMQTAVRNMVPGDVRVSLQIAHGPMEVVGMVMQAAAGCGGKSSK